MESVEAQENCETIEDVATLLPETSTLESSTPATVKSEDAPSSSALVTSEPSTPSSAKTTGRRNQKVRKSLIKPKLAVLPSNSDDEKKEAAPVVYGCGYERVYRVQDLSMDEVVTRVEGDVLVMIAAAAASSRDRLIEYKEAREARERSKSLTKQKAESSRKRDRKDRESSQSSIHRSPKSKKEKSQIRGDSPRPITPGRANDEEDIFSEALLDELLGDDQSEEVRAAADLKRMEDAAELHRKKERDARRQKEREEKEAKEKEERRAEKERLRAEKEERRMEKERKRKEREDEARAAEAKRPKPEPLPSPLMSNDDMTEDDLLGHFKCKRIALACPTFTDEDVAAAARSPVRAASIEPVSNRKHSLSVDVEPAAGMSSPERERVEYDSDAPDGDAAEINKRAKEIIRRPPNSIGDRYCAQCNTAMVDCAEEWIEEMGEQSMYCSPSCIDAKVKRAHEALGGLNVIVSVMKPNGTIKNDGPTVANLGQVLREFPELIPILPNKPPPKKTAVERGSKVMSKDSDQIRFNVRKAMGDALITRSSRTFKCPFRMKDCKETAERLELELFKACNQNATAPRYKTWFKQFLVHVKELKNKGFFYRILSGDLSLQKAASLEPEALGSPLYATLPGNGTSADVAKVVPVEGASKDELTIIEPTPSEHKPTPLSVTQPKRTVARAVAPARPTAASNGSTLDAVLGDGVSDTTAQHISHFYDANCTICAAKQKTVADHERKERDEKERAKEDERKRRELRRSLIGPDNMDMMKMFERERERDREQPKFDPKDPLGLNKPSPIKKPQRDASPNSTNAAYDSDDADYGGGSAGCSPQEDSWKPEKSHHGDDWRSSSRVENWRDQPSSARKAKSKFSNDLDPWERVASCEVWRGQIVMGSVVFVSSLVALSNPIAFEMSSNADLPAAIKIKGRIQPIIVFDYLSTLRKHNDKDVIVMMVEAPVDDDGRRNYLNLFDDMCVKDRYLVFEFGPESAVKDGYFMALPANREPPAVLLPFDGPGIPLRHPDMIVCIMVRHRMLSKHRALSPSIAENNDRVSSRLSNGTPKPADSSSVTEEKPLNGIATNNIPKDLLANFSESLAKVSGILAARKLAAAEPTLEPTPSVVPPPKSDSLLPSNFFDLIRKETPSTSAPVPQPQRARSPDPRAMMNPDNIHTMNDLLLFIKVCSTPKLLGAVMAKFLREHPEVTDTDKQILRAKVVEKIAEQREKKAAQNRLVQENVGGYISEQAQQKAPIREERPAEDDQDENSDDSHRGEPGIDRPFSPSDFESCERPSSFLDISSDVLTKLAPKLNVILPESITGAVEVQDSNNSSDSIEPSASVPSSSFDDGTDSTAQMLAKALAKVGKVKSQIPGFGDADEVSSSNTPGSSKDDDSDAMRVSSISTPEPQPVPPPALPPLPFGLRALLPVPPSCQNDVDDCVAPRPPDEPQTPGKSFAPPLPPPSMPPAPVPPPTMPPPSPSSGFLMAPPPPPVPPPPPPPSGPVSMMSVPPPAFNSPHRPPGPQFMQGPPPPPPPMMSGGPPMFYQQPPQPQQYQYGGGPNMMPMPPSNMMGQHQQMHYQSSMMMPQHPPMIQPQYPHMGPPQQLHGPPGQPPYFDPNRSMESMNSDIQTESIDHGSQNATVEVSDDEPEGGRPIPSLNSAVPIVAPLAPVQQQHQGIPMQQPPYNGPQPGMPIPMQSPFNGPQMVMGNPMMGGPPMQMMAPPPPQHGSAGFGGLAPSLGGKPRDRDSIIDFFNQYDPKTSSAGQSVPPAPNSDPSQLPRGTVPGFGKYRRDQYEDDSIPRTPTPSPSPSPPPYGRVIPGVRPGALRAGAPVRRVLPGARIPQRPPTPDSDELEMMAREERIRLSALAREQAAKLAEGRREMKMKGKRKHNWMNEIPEDSVNKLGLGKLPKDASPAVKNIRIRLIAEIEKISMEAAAKIVEEYHILNSDEEDNFPDNPTGRRKRDRKRNRRGGQVQHPQENNMNRRGLAHQRRTLLKGYPDDRSTAFVPVANMSRAMNVEYDEHDYERYNLGQPYDGFDYDRDYFGSGDEAEAAERNRGQRNMRQGYNHDGYDDGFPDEVGRDAPPHLLHSDMRAPHQPPRPSSRQADYAPTTSVDAQTRSDEVQVTTADAPNSAPAPPPPESTTTISGETVPPASDSVVGPSGQAGADRATDLYEQQILAARAAAAKEATQPPAPSHPYARAAPPPPQVNNSAAGPSNPAPPPLEERQPYAPHTHEQLGQSNGSHDTWRSTNDNFADKQSTDWSSEGRNEQPRRPLSRNTGGNFDGNPSAEWNPGFAEAPRRPLSRGYAEQPPYGRGYEDQRAMRRGPSGYPDQRGPPNDNRGPPPLGRGYDERPPQEPPTRGYDNRGPPRQPFSGYDERPQGAAYDNYGPPHGGQDRGYPPPARGDDYRNPDYQDNTNRHANSWSDGNHQKMGGSDRFNAPGFDSYESFSQAHDNGYRPPPARGVLRGGPRGGPMRASSGRGGPSGANRAGPPPQRSRHPPRGGGPDYYPPPAAPPSARGGRGMPPFRGAPYPQPSRGGAMGGPPKPPPLMMMDSRPPPTIPGSMSMNRAGPPPPGMMSRAGAPQPPPAPRPPPLMSSFGQQPGAPPPPASTPMNSLLLQPPPPPPPPPQW